MKMTDALVVTAVCFLAVALAPEGWPASFGGGRQRGKRLQGRDRTGSVLISPVSSCTGC